MSPLLIDTLYLISTALILAGVWIVLRPASAHRGVLFIGGGLLLALLATLAGDEIRSLVTALVGLGLGVGLGAFLGLRVTRESALERLALLAALAAFGTALIAPVRLHEIGAGFDLAAQILDKKWEGLADDVRLANEAPLKPPVPLTISMPAILATMLGGVASGSALIAFLKLSRSPIRKSLPKLEDPRMPQVGAAVTCLLLAMLFTSWPLTETFLWLELLTGFLLGYLLTIHLKIVDVPPVLAASVAVAGLSLAAAGMAIGNIVMVIAGALVTTGGATVAVSLCESLNVSLAALLLGTQTSKIDSREDAPAEPVAMTPQSRTVTPDPDTPII